MEEDYRGDQYSYDYGESEPQIDPNTIIIVGIAAGVASVIGAIIVWLTKLRQPKREKKIQQVIDAITAGKLDEWVGKGSSRKLARGLNRTADRAGSLAEVAGERAAVVSKDASKQAEELRKRIIKELKRRNIKPPSGEDVGSFFDDLAHNIANTVENVREGASPAVAEAGKRAGQALDSVRDTAAPAVSEAGKRIGQVIGDVTSSRSVKKAKRQVDDLRSNLAKLIDDIDLEEYQGKAKKQAVRLRSRAEQMLASLELDERAGDVRKAVEKRAKELGDAIDEANLGDRAKRTADQAREAISNLDLGQTLSDARTAVTDKAKELEKGSRRLRRDTGKAIGHASDEAGQMVQQASKQAGGWFGTIFDAVGSFFEHFGKETLPELTRAAGKAGEMVRGGVVLPAADKVGAVYSDTAPRVASAVSDAFDYVRDEAVPNVTGFVTDKALPAAGDFLSETGDRVQKAYSDLAPRVGDALGNVGEAVGGAVGGVFHHNGHHDGLLPNVGEAFSNVGESTGKALSSAGKATRKATRDTMSTIFWLGAAGAALVFLFAPEKQQRDELWRNIQGLISNARELVQEFQGYDSEMEK